MAENTADQAKRFIDASLDARGKRPSKAAYSRAVRLAKDAIEELTRVARKAEEGRA